MLLRVVLLAAISHALRLPPPVMQAGAPPPGGNGGAEGAPTPSSSPYRTRAQRLRGRHPGADYVGPHPSAAYSGGGDRFSGGAMPFAPPALLAEAALQVALP